MFDLSTLQSLVVTHLWQSVAVAAVLAAILIFGRCMSGAARYGIACAALAGSILLPLAAFLPGQAILASLLEATDAPVTIVEMAEAAPFTPVAPVAQPAIQEAGVAAGDLSASNVSADSLAALDLIASPAIPAAPAAPQAAAPAPGWTLMLPELDLPWLALPFLLVWVAGAALMLVRVARDLVAVERMVAQATPVVLPKHLAKRLAGMRVAISAEAPGPMAAGLLNPSVILPESALARLNSPEMTALLEHERAHIERRDVVAALAQRIALALLWWSPATYWISRRIDEEREVACDETAVERTGDARAFARTLTSQAETQLWAHAPRLAVGAIGQRSQFGRRIKRLIDLAKSGGAKQYSGRIAFSALALAIAAAVFVTPQIIADTPKEKNAPPPVDEALDGAGNWSRTDSRTDTIQYAQAGEISDAEMDALGEDLSGLGVELGALMEDISREIELSLGEEMPGLEGEMHGLGLELAALGVELGSLASEEVLREMPAIMEQVRAELAAEGIEVDFDGKDIRVDMQQLSEELRQNLGPEFREEVRAAMEAAREEIRASRNEMRATVDERRAGMDMARAAIAEARAEMAAARARGDFDSDRFDIRLDGGADGAARSRDWQLMDAAEDGDVKRVRDLIADGADVNRLFAGDGSALIAAARQGEVDVIRVLLDAGADIDAASPGDGNALIMAAANECEDTVRLLLDRGADVNAYVRGDETPLINAAREGELGVVRILVDRGADVNLAYRVNGKLRSPLGVAEARGHDDVAAFLKKRGAVAEPKPAN